MEPNELEHIREISALKRQVHPFLDLAALGIHSSKSVQEEAQAIIDEWRDES